VHGLGEVAHGIPPQGHVLDEPQDLHAVLGGDVSPPLEVLADELPHLRVPEILLGRQRDHQPARKVLGQAADLVGKARDVVLAHVRDHVVVQPHAGLHFHRLVAGGDARGIDGLVEVGHLHQLVLDVGDLVHAVEVGNGRGGTDEDVAHSRLAHVTAAVIRGEAFDEHGGEIDLAVHEDAFPGYEDVVKDDHRLLPAKLPVTRIDLAALHAAGVAGLPAVDVGDPRGVHGHGADDRVVLVGLAEAHRRHDEQPVRIYAPRLVGLGPLQVHALGRAPAHVHEEVGIGLLVGRLAPVALHVGHRAADHEAPLLHRRDESDEARVVGRAVLPVDLEGDRVERVDRIHADTALEAGARELAEPALHLVLEHQVVGAAGHVQEPVDPLAGVGRNRRSQVGIAHGQVVGLRHRIDGRPDHGVVHRLPDQLAEQEHPQVAAPQALEVLGAGADRPSRLPPDCFRLCGHVIELHNYSGPSPEGTRPDE
jgi:hypothetical protein